MNDKTLVFLRALEVLCREHDATITGCGCCGSPRVTVGDDDDDVENVKVLVGDVDVYEGDDGDDFVAVRFEQPTILVGFRRVTS